MKRSLTYNDTNKNFSGFELLTANELLQVRGGELIKPPSKPRDILDLD